MDAAQHRRTWRQLFFPDIRAPAWPGWLAEVLPLGLVMTLALIVRWPYLLEWPAFTDEAREVLLSVAVARGERWPWTNVNAYIGPWHVYLLAGLFKLAGLSIWLPRGLVMVLNVAAVGLTYLLGWRLAGRPAGLLAAGLASLSPMWVLVNSHVAWSASTTPVYVLGALLAAQLALGAGGTATWTGQARRRGVWLVAAGALLGLAGQTHPVGLLVAPGLALAVAWGRAGWQRLRTAWPWLAAVAALVAYAPVPLYSAVIQPGAAVAEAAKIGGARGLTVDLTAALARAPGMWWRQAQTAAGVAEPGVLPVWAALPVAAVTLTLLGLAAGGLVALWRRGERLLPLALAALLALLPVMTGYSGELFAERYGAPLVALTALLAAAGVVALTRGRLWPVLAVGLLLAGLPLTSLVAYYRQQVGTPNQTVIATAALLAPVRDCIRVALDERLALQATPGGGTAIRSLRMALALTGISWKTRKVHDKTMRDVTRDWRPATAVGLLTSWVADQRSLHEVWVAPAESGYHYGIYLYRQEALPACTTPTPPPSNEPDADD